MMISIIIPLYNKEKSIRSTVESVLQQNYPNFELIIINDGSTDDSLNIVQSIIDNRIRIISKRNGGVSSARNLGIKEARYQIITFLDGDDIWLPFCLTEFCNLIVAFPRAHIFCTNYNMTGRALTGSDDSYYIEDYYFTAAYYLAKWSIPIMLTGCIAVRKSVFDLAGYFNESATHGEDVEMWKRLTDRFIIAKSEKITTIYRIEAENRASLVKNGAKVYASLEKIKRDKNNSRSFKLYHGVQIVLDLINIREALKFKRPLVSFIKFPDWALLGVFFIIRVRFLKTKLTDYM